MTNALKVIIRHPEIGARRVSGLDGVLRRFLDAHELSPTEAVLVKRRG